MRLLDPDEQDAFRARCKDHFKHLPDFVEMPDDEEEFSTPPPQDIKLEAFRNRCHHHFQKLSDFCESSDDEAGSDGCLTPVSIGSPVTEPLPPNPIIPPTRRVGARRPSDRVEKSRVFSKSALRYPWTRSKGLERLSLDTQRKGFVNIHKSSRSFQVSFITYLRDFDPERITHLTPDQIKRLES
ncbi:MAG: hypothetical protein LQ342_007862 [Letrouitia transgressa]|nr:MAG: hypothetical protein LQ342_007862 [Letrouitia transgressa]